MKRFFKSLYLSPLLFGLLSGNVALFVLAHFVPPFQVMAIGALGLTATATLIDIAVLYRVQKGLDGRRITPEKLSNGDHNEITVKIDNFYNFAVRAEVIDELPFQFQKRDTLFHTKVDSGKRQELLYSVRPVKRGEYEFGALKVYVRTAMGIVARRFEFEMGKSLPVYPSYMQMR